ncbi:hypothetical protein FA13DRAFT_1786935 [Coprinellus micaceus]|uniref:Yeast cell wall synthesis Kre9/Knh1-like N-terminal domain-containing protein n=1 Tax=Coprinellus micaceus TaxID=71717 RepID=A0A4Y7TRI5_COPMI|nr:hypothetical protein FA13DRAFT_1786935 [Coprinellus micaceus]
MRFSTLAFAPIALLAAAVSAKPTSVFVPPVTAPVANDVWAKGSVQTVKWDISGAPSEVSNPVGSIFLRDVEKERILLDSPLADGFDILNGAQDVTVPTDVPAGPYQVVLIGNSGNWSPVFDIVD